MRCSISRQRRRPARGLIGQDQHRGNADAIGSAAPECHFYFARPVPFLSCADTSDAGLLAYRELDNTLGLTDTGADALADVRTGKNGRHRLTGLLRQSVFGRLAGYEDVNDAGRLCRDPAMRWVVGDRAITGFAASASQMGASRRSGSADPRTSLHSPICPASASTRCTSGARQR